MDTGNLIFSNISQGVLLVVLAIAVANKGTFGRKLIPWLIGLIGALLIAAMLSGRYIEGLAGLSLIMLAIVMPGKMTSAQKMLPWLLTVVRVILALLATVYILRSYLGLDTVWSLPQGLLLYVLVALVPSKAAPERILKKVG